MKMVVALLSAVLIGCVTTQPRKSSSLRSGTTNKETPAYTDDCFSEGGVLVYNKVYERKNLYCTNPKLYCTDSTTRFATMDITINDTILIPYDSLESAAYEIPLYLYHFKAGDSLRIVIRHYAGGKPKMLNPEVY